MSAENVQVVDRTKAEAFAGRLLTALNGGRGNVRNSRLSSRKSGERRAGTSWEISRILAACVGVFFAAAVLSTAPAAAGSDPITEWSVAASTAAAASKMAPLRTPITFAILHLAMYDAVNAVTGERETVRRDAAGRSPRVARRRSH